MNNVKLFIFITYISITTLLYSSITFGAEVSIDPDRMLRIDGKRTFILGMYSPNMNRDEELRALAQSGFNLVSVSPNESNLNTAQQYGLFVWVNIHNVFTPQNREEQKEQLLQLIELCKSHPSFLIWEMPDEALWNVYLRNYEAKRYKEPKVASEKISELSTESERKELEFKLSEAICYYNKWMWKEGEDIMKGIWEKLNQPSPFADYSMAQIEKFKAEEWEKLSFAYHVLKQNDSSHPVWMNFAPRNSMTSLRRFAQCADIVGCDIYPVPMHPKLRHSDLADQTMSCVGAYTRRMQEIDPYKPVWMVLQGFDWALLQGEIYERSGDEQRGFRPPTLQEIRFMGFDCIVNGARGILFWGTHYIDKNSQLWNDLLTFANEVQSIKHILTAEDDSIPVTIHTEEIFGSGDRGIVVLIKLFEQKPYIIVVNEWHECGIRYYLKTPRFRQGQRYRELYSEKEVEISENIFSYGIENFGVQIWKPLF